MPPTCDIFCSTTSPTAGAALGHSWAALDRFWPLLGRSWPLLGRSWPVLGRSWPALRLSWAALGRSWAALGPLLGRSTKFVRFSRQARMPTRKTGPSSPALGLLLAALGPLLTGSWPLLDRSWVPLGSRLGCRQCSQNAVLSEYVMFTKPL